MASPLLYSSLAHLWPIFSPPEDYVEEVSTFREKLQRHAIPDGGSVLHLGSGGGSVDHNLKSHYRVTGVELSHQMLDQARIANPEVEYFQGDIRDFRLERRFDAVLVHDAISYMTSVEELDAVYRTAAYHLNPGGAMIALPEELRERLQAIAPSAERHVAGDLVLDVMESHFDPDPADNRFESVYVFLIRSGEEVRVEVDRHTNGVFELEDFLGAIRRAGFSAQAEPWRLSEWGDDPPMPLITAVRL